MAGCLISPLQEIGKCILTQCVWPNIKSHFDYWWCFDNNIQGLRDGIEELKQQKQDIEQKIEEARLRTQILRPAVEKWLKASTEKLEEAKKILLPDDNIPKACSLISRYSMGKNAKETAEEIAKLLNDGNFNPIAYPAPPPAMGPTYHISTMDFESRKHIEEEIIDSLKQSSVIGISGMGGVGKTIMAKRIVNRLKEENLFDEVVMVTVSQEIDLLKIQEEIAKWLKLEFDGKHLPTRAAELRKRLMDAKKKIMILDDVWESLRFEDLGIPIESNCKVLLTSRSKYICKGIKNKKDFELKILEEGEAWNLFRETAGDCCVEDLFLHQVAKAIVAECKGLPIALVTVGLVLQHQTDKRMWKYALSKLKLAKPTDLPKEIMKHVYQSLELSYEQLDTDVEKMFFLMCCLFPEDHDISIEQLTWYCLGYRTHTLVEKLTSRFLLIDVDGCNGRSVKMHDVMRDVANYIGSITNQGFLNSLRRSSKENSSDVNCNWMSMGRMEVPVLSRFPKLRLLMLPKLSSNQFSDMSFEGIKDLNVLSFQSTSIRSLPPTLGLLENLRTLCLFHCEVENISVIGKLTSLKILSCCECYNITELPADMGRLKGLRLLELNKCFNLQRIPFGIISSLFLLEELKINRSFYEWETGGERRNASLTELECLGNLTCLEIEISDWTSSAQEIRLSQELVRYRIGIPAYGYFCSDEREYEKAMNLKLAGAVGNWIKLLARNAEFLSLRGDGSDNINIAEMESLRNLRFSECSTAKKLVDTSYLNQYVFCYLKSIYISRCSNLKHVFSVSVATTRLLQLEVLSIDRCAAMEQVFWNEVRDDTYGCIEFPKLKELILWNLPNLTALCQGLENIIIKFPNLTDLDIGRLPKLNSLSPLNSETVVCHDEDTCFHLFCNPKVEMGLLKKLTLHGLGNSNIRNIWCSQIPNNVFNNLEILDIGFMNGIRSLMSTSIAKNLVSLVHLTIKYCGDMVEVIERDDGDDKQVVDIDIKCLFPNLKSLKITCMPKLRRFWQWNRALESPLLEEMDIYNCIVMETFTLGSINTPNISMINVNN